MLKITQKQLNFINFVFNNTDSLLNTYPSVDKLEDDTRELVELGLLMVLEHENGVYCRLTNDGVGIVEELIPFEVVEEYQAESVYEIERGIPRPVRVDKKSMPLHSMEIGDSFFKPFNQGKDKDKQCQSIKTQLYNRRVKLFGKDSEIRFKTHRTEDGIRIWRVK